MGITLDGIFSQLENISKKLNNKEGKIENLKNEFDKKVGIQKEKYDKTVSLIEQLEDSEENMAQYDKELTETTNSLKDLDKAIQNLRDELSKPLSKKRKEGNRVNLMIASETENVSRKGKIFLNQTLKVRKEELRIQRRN